MLYPKTKKKKFARINFCFILFDPGPHIDVYILAAARGSVVSLIDDLNFWIYIFTFLFFFLFKFCCFFFCLVFFILQKTSGAYLLHKIPTHALCPSSFHYLFFIAPLCFIISVNFKFNLFFLHFNMFYSFFFVLDCLRPTALLLWGSYISGGPLPRWIGIYCKVEQQRDEYSPRINRGLKK